MINLYLDDLRRCPKNFVLAKTVEETSDAIYYLFFVIKLNFN